MSPQCRKFPCTTCCSKERLMLVISFFLLLIDYTSAMTWNENSPRGSWGTRYKCRSLVSLSQFSWPFLVLMGIVSRSLTFEGPFSLCLVMTGHQRNSFAVKVMRAGVFWQRSVFPQTQHFAVCFPLLTSRSSAGDLEDLLVLFCLFMEWPVFRAAEFPFHPAWIIWGVAATHKEPVGRTTALWLITYHGVFKESNVIPRPGETCYSKGFLLFVYMLGKLVGLTCSIWFTQKQSCIKIIILFDHLTPKQCYYDFNEYCHTNWDNILL